MKINAEKKAVEMAKLELSIWSVNHENELKAHFGFTDASLRARKIQLQKSI